MRRHYEAKLAKGQLAKAQLGGYNLHTWRLQFAFSERPTPAAADNAEDAILSGVADGGFALAALVEAMPGSSGDVISFGVGRAMAKEGNTFGGYGRTCGLLQSSGLESRRHARTNGFGWRADREDEELGRPIR